MAFNDIRIPRVPDKTFKLVKKRAKDNKRSINQEALALIEYAIWAEKTSGIAIPTKVTL